MSGQVPSGKLRRSLNAPLLTLYGLGVTVGAGIYVLVGATAAEAGTNAPFSFLIAALVVSLTALSYAELATRYPVSAGEAAYVDAGFGKAWLTLLVGLAVAMSGVVSASAVAIGAASYLQALTGFNDSVLTIAVVLLMGAIALWGITQSVVVAAAITVIEITGLLFVIYWGFGLDTPQGVTAAEMIPKLSSDTWRGVLAASLLAFFAFVGFEDIANVAEEVKEPVRTIPKAILWTLLIATGLYIATTIAVLKAVPLSSLSTSSAPLTLVFEAAPQVVKQMFSVIAIVATVNGVLIQMIMASRVFFGLAERGHLPALLATVSQRTQTPIIATLTVVAIILLLTQTLPIFVLAERTSQIVLCVFILVNLSLIRVKRLPVPVAEHFQVPGFVPVAGLVTSFALLVGGLL